MKYNGVFKTLNELNMPRTKEIEVYEDFFVEFYDELTNFYNFDIELYKEQAAKCGEEILELACGTGRITIPLAEARYNVTGIDLSKDMLCILKNKIAKKRKVKSRISIIEGNIIEFNLNKKFDLIILPATTICLILKDEDVINMFNCIHDHLSENGKFIFDIREFNENNFLNGAGEMMSKSWIDSDNNKRVVLMQEFIDRTSNNIIIDFYGEILNGNNIERFFSTSEKKWTSDKKIKELIALSKLKIEKETYNNKGTFLENIKFFTLSKEGIR